MIDVPPALMSASDAQFSEAARRRAFFRLVKKTPGCWKWMGTTLGRRADRPGYGNFGGRRNRILAHRYSYQIHVGEIAEGLTIDHLCSNTICVNPKHLEAVTMQVNLLRGNSVSSRNAKKTHCPRGHSYDGKNNRGERVCKTCKNELARARRKNDGN